MAVEEKFAEAWLNTSHKVLGVKLRPFSLWHRFLLDQLQAKILSESKYINVVDLYTGCMICRSVYPNVKIKIPFWRYFILNRKAKKISKELEAFSTYIADFAGYPEFWEKKDQESNKGPAPDPLGTVVSLMSLGFSENESWDMPIGKAAWYTAAHSQIQGADIDFLTAEEKAMQKEWKSMQDELDAAAEQFKKNFKNRENGSKTTFDRMDEQMPPRMNGGPPMPPHG